jgi:5,10-methylenetetrahydromethanopterin reductase
MCRQTSLYGIRLRYMRPRRCNAQGPQAEFPTTFENDHMKEKAHFWTLGVAAPRAVMRSATRAEAAGWDGLQVVDSQNLSGDAYVALAMAATVTEHIGLAPGVTNSVTRNAAVTAAAIASVDRVSGGRAVLGIGRGDSALAHLGRAPGRVAHFERYIQHVQTYLRGESVPFDEVDIPQTIAPSMSELEMADAPADSRIGWLSGSTKVPVEVAASGPRVIGLAARHADRVVLALGADPKRLRWGIDVAKKARAEAGLDPDDITFGAYIQCATHPDAATARELVRGGSTTFARFSIMQGTTAGPLDAEQKKVLEDVRENYDMKAHTHGDSRQAAALTEQFLDRFAVIGSPQTCVERLQEIIDLGITRIIITSVGRSTAEAEAERARELFEREVLPAVGVRASAASG